MKQKHLTTLWVKAIPQTHVREITEDGAPLMTLRFVGKQYNIENQEWEVLDCGQTICFHSYYLKCLREESLLPMNRETAFKAGVPWNCETTQGNK